MTVAPGAIEAMVQGKPEHGAVVESKRKPVGVASVMTTPVAVLGPRFVTARWNVMKLAELAWAGPLLVMRRSAAGDGGTTLVFAVEELLAVLPSNVELLTLAVFEIELPL